MPLITTHNYFADDCLKKAPTYIKEKININKNIYLLFAQGFDPLYFYDFFKLKKTEFQEYCHTNYTDTYFLNFINNIKAYNLKDNSLIISALMGSLTHYILDSTVHPFVVYKTGLYNKKNKETKKYQGLHSKMEMQLDAYLYEQKNNKPFKDFKIHKYLITKDKFSKELINILNKTYEETFNIKKGGNKYELGCKEMYYTYLLFIEDKTGIKTKVYKVLDKLFPSKLGKYETFSSHITNIDTSILNLEHKTWYNPWNKDKSNESFFDLYDKAKSNCLSLFIATHKFLNDEITLEEYQKELKNKSYLTGLPWNKQLEIKYLEF